MLFVANVWIFLLLANLPQYFKETNFIPSLASYFNDHGNFTNPYLYLGFLSISILIFAESVVWRIRDLRARKENKIYIQVGLSQEQIAKVQKVMQLKGIDKKGEAILSMIEALDLKKVEK